MEVRDWKQENLNSELNHGKEVATQLRNLLPPHSASETETFLIEKVLSSFEKALSIINRGASMEEKNSINGCRFQPPHFFPTSYSPVLERPDEESKHKNHCRKRKRSPQWNEQVKVSAGAGLQASPDHGYSWRKYGQKDILGASYPRSYYRCTHRHSQGCLATKQVQRSDQDPNIFLITYKGRHTCAQTAFGEQKSIVPQEFCFAAHAGEGLQLKTEVVDCFNDRIFPSFALSSPSLRSESTMENLFSGCLVPAISDTDYFDPNSFLLSHDLNISDSDLSDMISTPTSITNPVKGEFEFSLGEVDIELGFPFHDLDMIFRT